MMREFVQQVVSLRKKLEAELLSKDIVGTVYRNKIEVKRRASHIQFSLLVNWGVTRNNDSIKTILKEFIAKETKTYWTRTSEIGNGIYFQLDLDHKSPDLLEIDRVKRVVSRSFDVVCRDLSIDDTRDFNIEQTLYFDRNYVISLKLSFSTPSGISFETVILKLVDELIKLLEKSRVTASVIVSNENRVVISITIDEW